MGQIETLVVSADWCGNLPLTSNHFDEHPSDQKAEEKSKKYRHEGVLPTLADGLNHTTGGKLHKTLQVVLGNQ